MKEKKTKIGLILLVLFNLGCKEAEIVKSNESTKECFSFVSKKNELAKYENAINPVGDTLIEKRIVFLSLEDKNICEDDSLFIYTYSLENPDDYVVSCLYKGSYRKEIDILSPRYQIGSDVMFLGYVNPRVNSDSLLFLDSRGNYLKWSDKSQIGVMYVEGNHTTYFVDYP